jgi:hypothetical protein
MNKKLIVGAIAAVISAGAIGEVTGPPTEIVKKQQQTLQHYGAQSKLQGSKQRAEGYSARIGNMIKSLTQSKARFDSQTGSSSSNPYAKYNGVWEITTGSGVAQCSDGSSITLYQSASRVRVNVSPNGNVKTVVVESPPFPAKVLSTTSTAWISGNQLMMHSEQRYYWPQDRYHSQQVNDYAGNIKSNSYITGNQNMQMYFEEYGVRCDAVAKLSLNKVGN